MKGFGMILIILGIIMLVWTGFTYTKKEKVADIGPLEINADKEKSVNWSPYAGGALIIGGAILMLINVQKK